MVYFYDFENFELVSTSEKSTAGVKSVQFSFDGDSLYSLAGEVLRQLKWEPFRQLTQNQVQHGKPGDFILSQNKIISAGIKVRTESHQSSGGTTVGHF